MKIKFHDIPPEGMEFIVRDFSWFPDNELKRKGDFQAGASITKREHRVHVSGDLAGPVQYECDRCLEEFPAALESHFEVLLEYGGQVFSREHECSDADLDIMIVQEPVIDVDALFRQQVYLALPLKRLCSEGCRGLCSKCGRNRNKEECVCPQSNESSAFHEALAKLKKSSC